MPAKRRRCEYSATCRDGTIFLPFRFVDNQATPFGIKTPCSEEGHFKAYAEGRAKTSMIGI
jgi:hypothetical protein